MGGICDWENFMREGFYLFSYSSEDKYIIKITRNLINNEEYKGEYIFKKNMMEGGWKFDDFNRRYKIGSGSLNYNYRYLEMEEVCEIIGEELYNEWIVRKIL